MTIGKKYVYHINKDFAGKYLLPLSDLEKEYPKIYKQEVSKYKGREGLPKTKIDILECQWQDCVMFSTSNILDLFKLQKLLGVPWAEEVDELSDTERGTGGMGSTGVTKIEPELIFNYLSYCEAAYGCSELQNRTGKEFIVVAGKAGQGYQVVPYSESVKAC